MLSFHIPFNINMKNNYEKLVQRQILSFAENNIMVVNIRNLLVWILDSSKSKIVEFYLIKLFIIEQKAAKNYLVCLLFFIFKYFFLFVLYQKTM